MGTYITSLLHERVDTIGFNVFSIVSISTASLMNLSDETSGSWARG